MVRNLKSLTNVLVKTSLLLDLSDVTDRVKIFNVREIVCVCVCYNDREMRLCKGSSLRILLILYFHCYLLICTILRHMLIPSVRYRTLTVQTFPYRSNNCINRNLMGGGPCKPTALPIIVRAFSSAHT